MGDVPAELVRLFAPAKLTTSLRVVGVRDDGYHLIDAEIGLTDNDKKIADEIVKARKPMIIAVNKYLLFCKFTYLF